MGASEYTLKDKNEKKCIKMRINRLKIDIWESKLWVLCSPFVLKGYASAQPLKAIYVHNLLLMAMVQHSH